MSDKERDDEKKISRREFVKKCSASAAIITGGYEILSVFFKGGAQAVDWDGRCKSDTCALCGGSCQVCTSCTNCTSGCTTACTSCTSSCTSGCTSGCTRSCTNVTSR